MMRMETFIVLRSYFLLFYLDFYLNRFNLFEQILISILCHIYYKAYVVYMIEDLNLSASSDK